MSVSRVSRSAGPRRAITGGEVAPRRLVRRGRPPHELAAVALAGDHLEPGGLRPPLADIPLELPDRIPVGPVEGLQRILAVFRPDRDGHLDHDLAGLDKGGGDDAPAVGEEGCVRYGVVGEFNRTLGAIEPRTGLVSGGPGLIELRVGGPALSAKVLGTLFGGGGNSTLTSSGGTSISLFGGTAPAVALYFKSYGHEDWFYYYLSGMIFISLIIYATMRDTKHKSAMHRHQ